MNISSCLKNISNHHIIGWELTVEIYNVKNINFTMEIEKSDYVPFLDLRIIKNNNKLGPPRWSSG